MDSLWDEGFGAGISGADWLAVVAGRLLAQWQRRELYAGWVAGLLDAAAWRRDMERAEAPVAVCAGGEELPW